MSVYLFDCLCVGLWFICLFVCQFIYTCLHIVYTCLYIQYLFACAYVCFVCLIIMKHSFDNKACIRYSLFAYLLFVWLAFFNQKFVILFVCLIFILFVCLFLYSIIKRFLISFVFIWLFIFYTFNQEAFVFICFFC